MRNFISLRRTTALSLVLALVSGLFLFLPSSSALDELNIASKTTLHFNTEPKDEFKLNQGTEYQLSVRAETIELETEVNFHLKKSDSDTKHLIQTLTYVAPKESFVQNFKWDGKIDGDWAAPGTYTAFLQGKDTGGAFTNTLQHTFTVSAGINPIVEDVVVAPVITQLGVSVNPFSPNGDGYQDKTSISFDLNTQADVTLEIRNNGTDAVLKTLKEVVSTPKGSVEVVWDGKNNEGNVLPDGTYKIYVKAKNTVSETTATSTVTLDNSVALFAPEITQLGVSVNPFSPNGDGHQDSTTISFNLSTQAEVDVQIKNLDSINVRTLLDKAVKNAGNVSVVWDGKDTGGNVMANGEYLVVVTAKNPQGSTSKKINVKLLNPVDPINPPAEANCAGFTDLPKNYAHCDAVTFVKEAGIMTGNDNGTFDPSGILQRDQSAKISLETFKLYNQNKDYCEGKAAFPDVPQSQWAYQYVCQGKILGMITGYVSGPDAGKYLPGRGVNRVEAYALIFRNLSDSMPGNDEASYYDVPLYEWFTGLAKYAFNHSLFAGNYLYPAEQVNRLEMAQLLYKLDQLKKI